MLYREWVCSGEEKFQIFPMVRGESQMEDEWLSTLWHLVSPKIGWTSKQFFMGALRCIFFWTLKHFCILDQSEIWNNNILFCYIDININYTGESGNLKKLMVGSLFVLASSRDSEATITHELIKSYVLYLELKSLVWLFRLSYVPLSINF